ncbi:ribosomal RNA-processing protein 8 [Mucidula mucida]|nr:ribosomal RNA-processing protein 8 [Mucidula mucida]
MPLFEVPGWSVKADPVGESPNQASRKRKRNSEDSTGSEVNLDRLMNKLKRKPDKEHKASSSANKKQKAHEDKKNSISLPKALKGAEKRSTDVQRPPPKKKAKTKHLVESKSSDDSPLPSPQESAGLTEMQKQMRDSLNGARFRMINEKLYKTSSSEAHAMMQEDQTVFEEYHNGFRYQVQSWPTNPVEKYISALSSYPPKSVIVDLGCGDAALGRALLPRGLIVLSFDLISTNPFVIEADICNKLPLPGSEPDEDSMDKVEAQIVDVVVCALSLMGTNWPTCIREAWRVLRTGGELKIAEVASRFINVKQFISLVSSIGFRLSSKDDSNSHFTMFEFKKVARPKKTEADWTNLLEKGNLLKPCEYKRR